MFQATEWNPSKSGAANGIIGFFIGMSGFVGTIVCTLYVNPENILMDRVYDPDHPELGKLTNWILDNGKHGFGEAGHNFAPLWIRL